MNALDNTNITSPLEYCVPLLRKCNFIIVPPLSSLSQSLEKQLGWLVFFSITISWAENRRRWGTFAGPPASREENSSIAIARYRTRCLRAVDLIDPDPKLEIVPTNTGTWRTSTDDLRQSVRRGEFTERVGPVVENLILVVGTEPVDYQRHADDRQYSAPFIWWNS